MFYVTIVLSFTFHFIVVTPFVLHVTIVVPFAICTSIVPFVFHVTVIVPFAICVDVIPLLFHAIVAVPFTFLHCHFQKKLCYSYALHLHFTLLLCPCPSEFVTCTTPIFSHFVGQGVEFFLDNYISLLQCKFFSFHFFLSVIKPLWKNILPHHLGYEKVEVQMRFKN